MDEIKPLNFHKKSKSSFSRRVMMFILVLFIIGVGYLIWTRPIAPAVFNYVLGKESLLKVEDGRVNILLLGMAGGKHEGATLTDTIMVASYDTKTNQIHLISLPRDLWIDVYKIRVNALYQKGREQGDGLKFAETEIGNIVGLKIPYALRVDFSGFVKAVDLIGGLDVEVERAFEDGVYPIEGKETELCEHTESEQEIDENKAKELSVKPGKLKVLLDKDNKIATAAAEPGKNLAYTDEQVIEYFPCRYEHLQFKKGITHMDGTLALKFVRSRHGTNGEGSDFARSKRQQIVLKTFKDKVLSLGTLTNPAKVVGLANTLGSSVETDISEEVYIDFIDKAKKISEVKSTVIDGSGKNPLLINPPLEMYGGAWVLAPAGGNFDQIHAFVQRFISNQPESTISAQPTKK